MKPVDYLKHVANTIATFGHRGNQYFLEAFAAANAVNNAPDPEKYADQDKLKQVRQLIIHANTMYAPVCCAPNFDPLVADKYLELIEVKIER